MSVVSAMHVLHESQMFHTYLQSLNRIPIMCSHAMIPIKMPCAAVQRLVLRSLAT